MFYKSSKNLSLHSSDFVSQSQYNIIENANVTYPSTNMTPWECYALTILVSADTSIHALLHKA